MYEVELGLGFGGGGVMVYEVYKVARWVERDREEGWAAP